MTKFLISKGFDVNETNDLSETPLHLAAGAYIKGNRVRLLWLSADSALDCCAKTLHTLRTFIMQSKLVRCAAQERNRSE